MTLLVVGATGTLGRQVALHALEKGYKVRCLVRSYKRAAFLKEKGAELVPGDLCEPETLIPALEGVTAVIDAATARATEASIKQVDWFGKVARAQAPSTVTCACTADAAPTASSAARQRDNTRFGRRKLISTFSPRDPLLALADSRRTSSAGFVRIAPWPERGQHEQRGAADDEDVRQIEGGPVHVAPMQVEVVDHGADAQPVDDIAERAADQTHVGSRFESAANAAPQQYGECNADGEADRGQRVALPAARVGEERERRAGVEDMDKIEPGGDGDAFAQRQIRGDHPLDALIQHEEQGGDAHQQPPAAPQRRGRRAWFDKADGCGRHRSRSSISRSRSGGIAIGLNALTFAPPVLPSGRRPRR